MKFIDYIGKTVTIKTEGMTKGKIVVIESFNGDVKACVGFNNGFVGYYTLDELEFETKEDKEMIEKVECYKVEGEIYTSIEEAKKAEMISKLRIALDDLRYYGQYQFNNVDELVSELDKNGLEIVSK